MAMLSLVTVAYSWLPSPSTTRLSLDSRVEEFEAEIAKLRFENEGLVRTNRLLQQQQEGVMKQTATTPETCTIPDLLPMEEHFHIENVGVPYSSTDMMLPAMTDAVVRLAEMDDANVTRMVISQNGPGVQDLPEENNWNATQIMRAVNEGLLKHIDTSDGRFRALCNVHMSNVTAAISELQWCSSQGFPGVMLHGHEVVKRTGGKMQFDYYYHTQTLPFWKECVNLGMFVYLHPACMPYAPEGLYDSSGHRSAYDNSVSNVSAYANQSDASDALSLDCSTEFDTGRTWGYSLQVAQVVANLILHKLWDEVPDLQMVIGHQGELVTYWLWRIDHDGGDDPQTAEKFATSHRLPLTASKSSVGTADLDAGLDLGASAGKFTPIFQKNFYVTTSGYFDTPGLLHLLSIMPAERLLFSADTPYESMVSAAEWFRGIATTNPEIPCDTLQKIAYKNAELLLNWGSTS